MVLKLKRCPFCGEKDALSVEQRSNVELVVGKDIDQEKDRFSWYVVCENCFAQGPVSNEATAAEYWNKRGHKDWMLSRPKP
jgi:Lar family restriction alleviation protein